MLYKYIPYNKFISSHLLHTHTHTQAVSSIIEFIVSDLSCLSLCFLNPFQAASAKTVNGCCLTCSCGTHLSPHPPRPPPRWHCSSPCLFVTYLRLSPHSSGSWEQTQTSRRLVQEIVGWWCEHNAVQYCTGAGFVWTVLLPFLESRYCAVMEMFVCATYSTTVKIWITGCLYCGSSHEHLFCVNRWTILHLFKWQKIQK